MQGNTPTGKIGKIKAEVIAALGLSVKANTPIYLGVSNINHMIKSHPADFQIYGSYIQQILDAPDFVGINPKDQSIEYVKEFIVNNEYVKVAVRVSTSGIYFARSLYILNSNRVHNFINKGTLIPLTKSDE